MFVETYGVVTGTVTLAESKVIRDFATRIFKRIKDGKRAILIFGAAGTGKSTLGGFLQDGTSPSTQKYQESLTIETLKLPGTFPGCTLIAPGQEQRQNRNLARPVQAAGQRRSDTAYQCGFLRLCHH